MQIKVERAVLVGLNAGVFTREETATEQTLDELEALLQTAGGTCCAKLLQNRPAPDPHTFLGEGKVQELREIVDHHAATMVIFDNDLTPAQNRTLEKLTEVPVIDRSALILDIFAQRARTREGKLQVELAQYKYLLPRLAGMWTHLERQEGAIGTRGPGETQLETDRRLIRARITRLEAELKEVRKNRAVQRERRIKNSVPVVALVGYTNAGKSTLLNRLTGAGIPANDRLFDTLDTTARQLEISDTLSVVLTDTVGFIAKLPHHLVEAFRATLEELQYADLLIHVIDGANPNREEHIAVVNRLIAQLAKPGIPVIEAYNKADQTAPEDLPRGKNQIAISARTGMGLDALFAAIEKNLAPTRHHTVFLLPYSLGGQVDLLHTQAKVLACDYLAEGIRVEVICDDAIFGRLRPYETGCRP